MNRKIKNRKIIHFNRKNKIFKLNKKITKNNIYFLKKAFPSVSLDWKEIIFEFKLLTVNGVQKLKKKKNIYPQSEPGMAIHPSRSDQPPTIRHLTMTPSELDRLTVIFLGLDTNSLCRAGAPTSPPIVQQSNNLSINDKGSINIFHQCQNKHNNQ